MTPALNIISQGTFAHLTKIGKLKEIMGEGKESEAQSDSEDGVMESKLGYARYTDTNQVIMTERTVVEVKDQKKKRKVVKQVINFNAY